MDYKKADMLYWGRGLGCEFAMTSCMDYMERQHTRYCLLQGAHLMTCCCFACLLLTLVFYSLDVSDSFLLALNRTRS